MKKKTVVTNKLANAIREARLSGMTYRAIMLEFDVSESTARFYSSDANADKMRKYEQDRYRRMMADPERYAATIEKRRERIRAYHERMRQEARNAKAV
jgi:hypothetical protein